MGPCIDTGTVVGLETSPFTVLSLDLACLKVRILVDNRRPDPAGLGSPPTTDFGYSILRGRNQFLPSLLFGITPNSTTDDHGAEQISVV